MKIGLFFGSFNPIHVGHLILAEFFATRTDLDEVWLVVSPQNPLKLRSGLLDQYQRLDLAYNAVGDNPKVKVSDVEFQLPIPSFTIDTITFLNEKYPDREFVLIMGQDNVCTLPKWKNYELLLSKVQVYVYPRISPVDCEAMNHKSVFLYDAPVVNVSSTDIRKALKQGYSVRYLVPDAILEQLSGISFYKK